MIVLGQSVSRVSGSIQFAGYRQTAYTRTPHAAMKTSFAFGPSIVNQNKNIRME
jgi:hypothetical protein